MCVSLLYIGLSKVLLTPQEKLLEAHREFTYSHIAATNNLNKIGM